MAVDKKKMDEAFQRYMKNPAWKREYENAPSKECKEYLRYTYYSSQYYDPDADDAKDFDDLQQQVESKMNVQDWEYIKSTVGNSPFVAYCNKKIKELQQAKK